MIIELRGVEFVNKGAELMLHAIIQEITSEIPNVKFVMERTKRVPLNKLKQHGIFVKTNLTKKGINFGRLIDIVPNSTLNSYGWASESQIDVVMDGSGFAFGDKWGARKAGYRMADHILKWKKQGKKIILLPQAFGPFTDPELVEKMKVILENADLIFARDSVSYQYLSEVKQRSNLSQFPDFTNIIKGFVPNYFSKNAHQIGVIPNQKMMETENEDENQKYPEFLVKVIESFQSSNEIPFFLIHESKMDYSIAQRVNAMLKQPIEIIREENPLAVKGIIGACKAVVTSRFHGLVSALSQSIPCLATGWSHKYETLLDNYGYREGICSVNDTPEVLESKIESLLNSKTRNNIISRLSKNSDHQKELTRQMWKKVYTTIK